MTGDKWRVDHIGIAVEQLESAIPRFRALLGVEPSNVEDVPSEGVRVAFFELDGSRIELLEATRDDSPIRRFLDKGLAGIHHVALEVPGELGPVIERLDVDAIPTLGGARAGSHGTTVCFLHPKAADGALIELVGHCGSSHLGREEPQ